MELFEIVNDINVTGINVCEKHSDMIPHDRYGKEEKLMLNGKYNARCKLDYDVNDTAAF